MKYITAFCLLLGWLLTSCNGSIAQNENSKESAGPTSISKVVTPIVTQEPTQSAPEVTPPVTTEMLTGSNPLTNVITILSPRPPATLDPYRMTTVNPEESIAVHLWDALVWLNDELQLEPRLAVSWRLVNDTTWEFKLRPDVTFQNGEPFNATVVKFSLERAAQLEGGVESFVTDVGLRRIEILDDYTLQLVITKPDASLPYQLAGVEMLPPIYYSASDQKFVTVPVGSGPYRFGRREADGTIILEANPNYWQGEPAWSTLVFRPVDDPTSRLDLLLDGEAQLSSNLLPDQMAALVTEGLRAEPIESTRRFFIGIRFDSKGPLSDKRVRQALNYAVNVEDLIKEFAGGYGQRYGSWVNPPYNLAELSPWPYDPDQAKTLLAEAGYTNGFEVTLDTSRGHYEQDQAIAEAIAKQLAQVGIRVKVQSYNWPDYVAERLIPKKTSSLFLLSLASQGGGLTDMNNLSTDFPFNPTLWQNVQFQDLVAKAKATFNETQRQSLLNQAQKIAYEESPWIWLWRPYDFYGVAASLEWQPRADGLINLYRTEVSN